MEPALTGLIAKSKKAALVFRAVNNKLRQQMIQFILDHPATTVSNLYKHFLIEQSLASHQLSILRKQGIVTTQRTGKHIHYSVNKKRLEEIEALAEQLVFKTKYAFVSDN